MGGRRLVRWVMWSAVVAGCGGVERTDRPTVGLPDVSLLWPLPAEETNLLEASFLRASSRTGEGALLPREVFGHIPALTRMDEPDALYANLVVVGARLDPCFQEGAGSPPCQPNLRLVLQPVFRGKEGWETRDASVHVFYSAQGEDEVLSAIESLARERLSVTHDVPGPLGVHPLLDSSSGRERVQAILLPLLGANRLSRVTSVGVHGDNAAWTFSGFDWVDGAAVPIVIPQTSGATEQHYLSSDSSGLTASTEPPGTSPDDFSSLLAAASRDAASLEARQRAYDAAARVENPALHNAGTLDCVSCHVSSAARAAAESQGALQPSPDAYVSTRFDLTPTSSSGHPQQVRVFGYRFKEPVLSPRLLNESAAVADRVNATLQSE